MQDGPTCLKEIEPFSVSVIDKSRGEFTGTMAPEGSDVMRMKGKELSQFKHTHADMAIVNRSIKRPDRKNFKIARQVNSYRSCVLLPEQVNFSSYLSSPRQKEQFLQPLQQNMTMHPSMPCPRNVDMDNRNNWISEKKQKSTHYPRDSLSLQRLPTLQFSAV
jgi:hypothetical protein